MSAVKFPNVPFAPGVPNIARAIGQASSLVNGGVTGVLNAATQKFTGQFSGVLSQANGRLGQITGPLSGVIDPGGNLSAILGGDVGGAVLGRIVPVVSSAGVFSGPLSGVLSNQSGELPQLLDDNSAALGASEVKWGVFDDDGNDILVADTVVDLAEAKDYRVASYPFAPGSFTSYNKVETPGELNLMFAKSGSLQDRTVFLQAVDALCEGTDLYNIVMPEKTFTGYNAVRRGMVRTATRGAQMLYVELTFQQIRVTASQTFVPTKTDAGAEQFNGGPVQPKNPSTSQAAAITGVQ
jgi:hypothetical protein